MSASIIYSSEKAVDSPRPQKVPLTRPVHWLRLGWTDLVRHWPASLALGAVFALAGHLLVNHAWAYSHVGMALTTGFLLLAPFLAVGFYDLSRRDERIARGETAEPFQGLRRNAASVGLFALLLAFILSVWERLSALIVGLFFSAGVNMTGEFSLLALWSAGDPSFMVAYLSFGLALAGLTFALAVVSVPMLIDREVDVISAMLTSLRVVRENPGAMLLWALVIVGLSGFGMATAFVGLAVLFPLLGHASWHAYRDLVTRD